MLAWDIETLPVVATTFRLRDAYIPHDNIVENTSLVCASWRYIDHRGEPKSPMRHASIMDDPKRFKKDIYDDKHVIEELHKALSEADVYLYQNGAAFDLKHFNARALYHGLTSVPKKQEIDTLKQARKHFRMDSNRLDYIGRFLGVGEKMDTGGMELWNNITQLKYPPVGKEPDKDLAIKSIKKMIRYNKQDVNLLIDVFKELRPYIDLPNFSLYMGKVTACSHCGGQDIRANGWRYTKATKHRRYWCKSCNKAFDPPRTQGKWIDAEFSRAEA